MSTKSKKAAPPVEELDDDDLELDDDDEEVEEAPAKSKKAKAAPKEDEVWGVRNLIDLIKAKTGKEYKPREVRTLLRKLAREGGGVNREIIAGNKSRYAWSGPDDPEVKAVLKAVKGGAIEQAKTDALAKLKADKAKKQAAKEPAPAKKGKKAPKPPVDEDDDDDLEEMDDDD